MMQSVTPVARRNPVWKLMITEHDELMAYYLIYQLNVRSILQPEYVLLFLFTLSCHKLVMRWLNKKSCFFYTFTSEFYFDKLAFTLDAKRRLATFTSGRFRHLLKIDQPFSNYYFFLVKLNNRWWICDRLKPFASCRLRQILVASLTA